MNESQNKIRVAVFAGARSTEHEVSLASAYNIVNAIDQSKYEIYVVGIDKDGVWRQYAWDNFVFSPDYFPDIRLSDQPVSGRLAVRQSSNAFYDIDSGGSVAFECDVIFPAVLGNYAEDGTMQGLLRMMDVPFTTPDVLGSSVAMDKDVAYRLFRDAGIPVAPFVTLRPHMTPKSFADYVGELGATTLFVKPSNAGSSVGVSKVTNQDELTAGLALAFKYDVKVLIQAGLVGRELEMSVSGNIGNQFASTAIGEITAKSSDDFYSYDNKYVHSENVNLVVPANVDEELAARMRAEAIKACEVLEVEGFGRVDFFVTSDGTPYLNEINTMPGFTQISMFPKLWIASGKSYAELVDWLLTLAIERHDYRIKPMILNADDVLTAAREAESRG